MTIDILIPTYNRYKVLKRNLISIEKQLVKYNLLGFYKIIVCDNASPDRTYEKLKGWVTKMNFEVFVQDSNIGLEKNALKCLELATGHYVMYLGDDDFLNDKYLLQINDLLKDRNNYRLNCIIPSILAIDERGDLTGYSRDLNLNKIYYNKGILNCLFNSWRGHQLSGLLFKRKGVLEIYKERGVSNLYPFIYFVSYSCLVGDTLILTEYPVKVTQLPQSKKDWDYNLDGLISEVNDNYMRLPLNWFYRNLLQMVFLFRQKWRYLKYVYNNDLVLFYRSLFEVVSHKNSMFLTKIFAPFIYHFNFLRWWIVNIFVVTYRRIIKI